VKYNENWELETFFEGGSLSDSFNQFVFLVNEEVRVFNEQLEKQGSIKELVLLYQDLNERLDEASSFVRCLVAQDVLDKGADLWHSKIEASKAAFSNASNRFDYRLAQLSDQDFLDLLKDNDLKEITFPLAERRLREKQKLNLELEALINDLSIDGYHSWSHLYNTILGQEIIPIEMNGKLEELSWGQAYNLLSSSNRTIRKTVFDSSNKVWDKNQSLYGQVINHIAGFRLKVYQHRQWDVLKEPLEINRMDQKTLEVMWQVIDDNKSIFIDYMQIKARLNGLDKLSWYDQDAPLAIQETEDLISYDEAADFIIEQFSRYSPKMASFAKKALTEGWVEAENRGGKRPGGFCTGFPIKKESRIFMTYSGTNESLITLAHELGHAFHNHVIYELPSMAQCFPMNLAETASTFAEMVVSEAALEKETNELRRLAFLNVKLQRSLMFLFNIHCRFIFETKFYEECKHGPLSCDRICYLMEEAQKQSYHGALQEYNPYFWASKMHFSLTEIPFYNFPYTFGYLFSTAIYNKAKTQSSFEDTYIALLADTGRMKTEDLAQKHIGVDLTKREFWQQTIDILKQDAHLFLEGVNKIYSENLSRG
jgi:oligoendopeptidase F